MCWGTRVHFFSSPWTSGSHLLEQGKKTAFVFFPAGNLLAEHLVASLQGMHGVGVAAGPMLCWIQRGLAVNS